MTGRTGFGQENLLACGDFQFGSDRSVLPLQARPLVKGRLLLRNDKERHMGVLQAAEFGTLAAIHARTLCPDGKLVWSAGNQILFARKAWHPKRVNYIEAFELKAHIAPDWNMNLVRCLEAVVRC